ncbi:MAG: Lrp/AsnC family transcriptional regulator [Rhodospirillaceae bacterium]|nr:Lrp/AsnC family transcriptional regulator [Rhodospirillaceae bacterium]
MAAGLDKVDLRILAELQEDASRSSAEISEVVGVSTSTCGNRIKRLMAEGYVKKTVAVLNRDKLDMRTQFFVKVTVRQHDPQYLRDFTERMKTMSEVLECHVLLGDFDFLLRVVTPDLHSYEDFYFKKLSCIPGVREASTFVSLSEVKMTTTLPLPRT